MILQGVHNDVFGVRRDAGQADEYFRPTVNLAAFIVHDAAAQCAVGHGLVICPQGGVNVQPAGVGVVTILRKHQLANGFCHIFCMNTGVVRIGFDLDFFKLGRCCLLGGDKSVGLHALNDVQLA